MKKLLKYTIIVSLIFIVLILAILLIYNNKKTKEINAPEANTIIATKTTENSPMGNYEEELIVVFENDKANNIEIKLKFQNNEDANEMYGLYNYAITMMEEDYSKGISIIQEENNVIISMDANTYAKTEELSDEEMTKEALKKMFEEEGYMIK